MGQLAKIPISQIRENIVALRSVQHESEEFQGLVASIRNKGFLGAISVRARTDDDTKEKYYELVDGLQRFHAAREAGLAEINADIVDLDDHAVLEAQIMANIHRIETKPVEYSKQLHRILGNNLLMTESDLAGRLGKSTQWIKERLGLNKITNEKIAELVDNGNIGLANAYALAKLPPEEQADWVDRAMTLGPDEFVPKVNKRVKEIREERRKGKQPESAEFQPVAHLQKIKAIKEEMEKLEALSALIKDQKITSPIAAAQMALRWVLHLDPKSIEIQKIEEEQRKVERTKAKEERDLKKAQEKAQKAQEKAEKAAIAAEEAKAKLGV